MNRWYHRLLFASKTLLISVFGILCTTTFLAAVSPSQSASDSHITVLAAVTPARYIIINDNLQITQIVSNTNQDIVPIVLLRNLDGQAIPYTESIRSQYVSLKSQINFNKAGVVYESQASHSPLSSLSVLQRWLGRFIFG